MSVTPCGTRWGRIEFRQRILGIGRPVAAGFGHVDESGAQRERRLTGKIGDCQHFVAQRRHEQQIHFGKDAGHFFGDFAAEAVGLHKIDGRKKSRLAKKIWPRIRNLRFEFAQAAFEREFFECGSAFGKENEL